jgi:hypothetical protein
MRIFLSCLQAKRRHQVPAYEFWENYFKKGIEEAGHEWVEAGGADWAEGLVYSTDKELHEWRERTWSETVTQLKREHRKRPIDLFLSYLFPKQVDCEAVREIQSAGVPCVNFYCDNVRDFVRVPYEFHCFDAHWVPEHKAFKMYRRAGLNYMSAPMPVWITPGQRTCIHPETYPATFIGSRDAQREALFAEAVRRNARFEIRGPGWLHNEISEPEITLGASARRRSLLRIAANQKQLIRQSGASALLWKLNYKLRPNVPNALFESHTRGAVFGEGYVRVTQQSMITIGVNRYPSFRHSFSNPDTYSRLRDLEAPMMGACYLTEWTEGLSEMYEIGEEIETYRTAEEMVTKINELQADPEKRQSLRCKGQKRALAHHTITQSLSKLKAFLGLQ